MLKKLKKIAKAVFHGVGLDVRGLKYANTEEQILARLLELTEPAALLDVGANLGQFADKVRDIGYRGKIISFEALPNVHADLAKRAQQHSQWVVAPCAALGSAKSVAEMNVSANTESSSLLPMKDLHSDAAPEAVYVGKQITQVERLDDLAQPYLPMEGDLFLKVDTQGYEKEVLRGSTGLLGRVSAMQIELSLTPVYDNAPTALEMIQYIGGLGYEIFNLVPSFIDYRTGRVLQIDGFFVRAAERG